MYTQRIVEILLEFLFSWPLTTIYKINIAPVLLFLYRSFIPRTIAFFQKKNANKITECNWFVLLLSFSQILSLICYKTNNTKQIIVIVFTHYLDHKNVFFIYRILSVWPRVFKTAELLICFVHEWYDGSIYVDRGRECLRL